MHQEFSLSYLTVYGRSPPQMVETAARAGYDYVSLRLHPVTSSEPVFPLATDRALRRQTQERLAATGIGVLDVELVRLTPAFRMAEYEALLDVAASLGARHVIAQAPDSDLSRAIDHFSELCDAAGKRNLTVDLEFVTWTETRDLERAARIVRGAGRDNGGVLVDTLHFSRSGCNSADLAQLPRPWFHFAQVCDAPPISPETVDGLIHAARSERLFLGEGGLDVRGILGALPTSIPYALEIPRASLAREVGLDECARRALVTAQSFVATLHAYGRGGDGPPTSHLGPRG